MFELDYSEKLSAIEKYSEVASLVEEINDWLFENCVDYTVDNYCYYFARKEDLIAFKLRYENQIEEYSKRFINPVLLGIIRRSMPNLIAQSIVGVQPMTGPASQIFSMKTRYLEHNDEEDDDWINIL